jgi:hypothetical protein
MGNSPTLANHAGTAGAPRPFANQGHEKRRQADEALENCVLNTGRQMKENISSKLGVTPENVIAVFAFIADLMYRAVRIDGKPCSAYSWRWGYGWLPC